MSIDNLLVSLGLRPQPNALEAQIHALRREIRRIGRGVSSQAGHTAEDWGDHLSDFGQQAARQGVMFADIAAHQAQRGARTIAKNPVPAVALVGTALLLAHLFRR